MEPWETDEVTPSEWYRRAYAAVFLCALLFGPRDGGDDEADDELAADEYGREE